MTNKSKAIRQHHFGGTVDLQWSTLWAMLNSSRTGKCQRLFFFLGGDADAPKGGGEVGRGEVGLGVRERVASRSPPVPHKEERSTRGTQEVMGGEKKREGKALGSRVERKLVQGASFPPLTPLYRWGKSGRWGRRGGNQSDFRKRQQSPQCSLSHARRGSHQLVR